MDRDQLLQAVYARVPAYRAFLDARGGYPGGAGSGLTEAAWVALPLTNKADYLLRYPTDQLCWDGTLDGAFLIGASSGFSRTGSIFWPKSWHGEEGYPAWLEAKLIELYAIDRRRTLAFVCLALGTWFGGMQLAATLRQLAATGRHPLTVATPGLHLAEAVDIYAQFGHQVEQVLWFTNPSNVNLIAALLERRAASRVSQPEQQRVEQTGWAGDAGADRPPLPPYDQGTMSFAVVGEYFGEGFRERVARQFGHPADAPFAVWTGYGSADAGGIGVETEPTIRLRKHLFHRPELSRRLFGTEDTPMLLEQAGDCLLEVVNGNLVVTKDQLVPLVRYDTGDAGGVLTRDQLDAIPDLPPELRAALPERVLYVFGRAGDAVIFYGTNLTVSEMNNHLLALPDDFHYGGLFDVRLEDRVGIDVLAFTIYVRDGTAPGLAERYRDSLLDFLTGRSLEFRTKYENLTAALGEPLISVTLEDIEAAGGNLKHRFIVG